MSLCHNYEYLYPLSHLAQTLSVSVPPKRIRTLIMSDNVFSNAMTSYLSQAVCSNTESVSVPGICFSPPTRLQRLQF